MINVEKFYRIASRYVGVLNKDLVHHVFEKTYGKLPPANPDAYFYRVMMNELRNDSKFKRHYSRIHAMTTTQYENELTAIDPERVERILNEIAADGFDLEVKVFIEMANDSALRLNKITGVRYENLLNIRNFVKNEVLQRYGSID